jgi:hypothetical protein
MLLRSQWVASNAGSLQQRALQQVPYTQQRGKVTRLLIGLA